MLEGTKIRPFEDLREEFLLRSSNYYYYVQVSNYILKKIIPGLREELLPIECLFLRDKVKGIITQIYKAMEISKGEKEPFQRKWEADLGLLLTEQAWAAIF